MASQLYSQIAALFTIAETWKRPQRPSTDEEDKEDVLHVYTGILLLLLLSRFSHVPLCLTP